MFISTLIQFDRTTMVEFMRLGKLLTLWVAVVGTIFCFACTNPRGLPGIRGIVSREGERITKETREAMKKSPALQELDRVCSQDVLHPHDSTLVSQSGGTERSIYLVYGYSSGSEYDTVRKFYANQLNGKGWKLIREREAGWGPKLVEFTKGEYRIEIAQQNEGTGVDYTVQCQLFPAHN